MIETAIAAFAMGVIGSFHCVGMCGPLALALPLKDDNLQSKFIGALLYNSGRIVTYSLFGLVAGLLGKSFALFGFQQWLSIVAGSGIVLLLILPKLFPLAFKNVHIAGNFFQRLRHYFGQLFFKKNQSTLFAIGFLNGLLPCGLVYLAIAAATATGDPLNAVIFMAAFGLGTLPVMWSIAFWKFYWPSTQAKIRAAYPYMMMLMACLLILRGMGLGIPYVSPAADAGKKIINCCAKP
ncbi:MAG: sulfite exporter TauE/SafE family protein [Chitinophagaceae bacterium]|nr:sulfite exporter TauE/SafE family protein [Chitinophagaceae bacterium]